MRTLLISISLIFLMISCGDSATDPEGPGTIYVESEPSGAEIWIDNSKVLILLIHIKF
jgi:hypothetical protein